MNKIKIQSPIESLLHNAEEWSCKKKKCCKKFKKGGVNCKKCPKI